MVVYEYLRRICRTYSISCTVVISGQYQLSYLWRMSPLVLKWFQNFPTSSTVWGRVQKNGRKLCHVINRYLILWQCHYERLHELVPTQLSLAVVAFEAEIVLEFSYIFLWLGESIEEWTGNCNWPISHSMAMAMSAYMSQNRTIASESKMVLELSSIFHWLGRVQKNGWETVIGSYLILPDQHTRVFVV